MRFSTVLKVVPYYIILSMVILYFSVSNLMDCVNNEKSILESQYKYISLAAEFENNSEYLSRVMRAYFMTGNNRYEELYVQDIMGDRTNAKIAEELNALGLSGNQKILAEEILNTSDKIHQIEISFLQQNPEFGVETASELFSNIEYISLKFELSAEVNTFNDYIIESTSILSQEAYLKTKNALILLISVIFLSITTLSGLFYYYKVKLHTINGLVDVVTKIADGNFNVDLSIYNSKDEFGTLASSFSKMIDSIMNIIWSIDFITEQQELGNTKAMLDVSEFKGSYREVAYGVNNLLNSYNKINDEMNAYLQGIARGDLSVTIPEYSGDRRKLTIAAQNAKDNILIISHDINYLIDRASSGLLITEPPTTELEGEWDTILNRIYSLPQTIFDQIIQTAPMAYFLVKDDHVVERNAFCKSTISVYADENFAIFKDLIYEYYCNSEEEKETGSIIKFRTGENEYRRFSIHMSRIINKDEFADVVWAFDVEEREAKSDQLSMANESTQAILNAINVPILISKQVGYNILYFNNAAKEKLLVDDNNEEHLYATNYLPEFQEDGTRTIDTIAKWKGALVDNDLDVYGDIKVCKSNGETFDSKLNALAFSYHDEKAILSVIQDITLDKQKVEMLESAAKKEHDANELKGRFLVNMSHEIRTPMNAIIGLSDVALLKDQTPENYDVYKKINVSSKNLLNVINDILDFSKIEAEKLDLVLDLFLLEDIVANAFMVASERAINKPIEMLFNVSNDVPLTLFGDKTRVWQILKNLLDNSAKYTVAGKIILDISINESITNDEIVGIDFVISDTGYGMSEEQLEKLFVAFEQFHNKAKNTGSGTGLGMSIVKQLIDLMGGTIDVKSTENVGTTTTVTIPFKRVEDAMTIKESANKEILKGEEVLLLDDDTYALDIMKDLIGLLGAKVDSCKDAKSAYDKVAKKAEKGEYYKLILIDYLIGNENGVDFADDIKELIGDKSKLVLVSAYSKNFIEDEIKTARFNDIIQKPFMPSAFIAKITQIVRGYSNNKKETYKMFKGAKVLICEDNPINQDVASAIFDIFGITPTLADNGQIGMNFLEKAKFDIVFMDLLMPVMDGYETTRAIRNLPETDKNYGIPVLAMTANVMTDIIDKCLKCGMQDLIGKPIDIANLNNALDKYLPSTVTRVDPDEENVASDLISIDGIDMQEGVLRFGGKKDVYYKTLIKYAFDTLIKDEPYSVKILPENRERFKMEIHTVKGVSGNLAIKELFELCKDFEVDIKNDTISEEKYNDIINKRYEICENIKEKLYDYIEVEPDEKEQGSDEEFDKIVIELKEALENFDIELAEDFVKILKSKTWNSLADEQIEEIYGYVSDYNFDDALDIISNFS